MKYTIREISSPVPYCKAYKFGRCHVLVGQEPGIGWHMSISHHRQNPTWEEIRDARYHFIPDNVTMAMILPPKRQYVNIHEYCFHLHEIPTERDGMRDANALAKYATHRGGLSRGENSDSDT